MTTVESEYQAQDEQSTPQPVFLRAALVEKAVALAAPSVLGVLNEYGDRVFVHVVVLDPHGAPIFDAAIGNAPEGPEFEDQIREIARGKAKIHFRTGKSSSVVRDNAPHLLCVGDTVHGGSVDIDGLIVAVSGVQPHVDEGIAGIVASTCWMLCKHAQADYLANNTDENIYVTPVDF